MRATEVRWLVTHEAHVLFFVNFCGLAVHFLELLIGLFGECAGHHDAENNQEDKLQFHAGSR